MTWYIALCLNCTPILPIPFNSKEDRVEWTLKHLTTGHAICFREQEETK